MAPLIKALAVKFQKHPLIRGSFVYGASSLFSKAMPFLLLPVLTGYLTPNDYGVVSTVLVIQAIIAIFLDFGVSNFIGANYFRSNNKRELLDNSICVIFTVFVIVSLVMISVLAIIPNLFPISLSWIFLLLISSFTRSIWNIQLLYLQLNQYTIRYALIQNSATFIETSLILILVVFAHLGWQGRTAANLLVGIIFGVVSIWYLYRFVDIRFSTCSITESSKIAKFGAPLILHSAGAWFITSIDRYLIALFVSNSATGIYTVAQQISSIAGFLTMAFNQAWSPYLYKKLSSATIETKTTIVAFTYAYAVALFAFCIIFYLVATIFIPHTINHRYIGSLEYLPWMLGQVFFWGMYFMVTNYIFFANQAQKLAAITITAGLFSFGLNYLVIQKMGASGAAISGFIISCAFFFSVWLLSAKVYPMPWLKFRISDLVSLLHLEKIK